MIAATVPSTGDEVCSRRHIALEQRGQMNGKGNEGLDTSSISHRPYNLLRYVFYLQLDVTDAIQGKEPDKRLTHQLQGERNFLQSCSICGMRSSARTSLIFLRSFGLMQHYG